jgi:hypothetical protein
MRDVLDAYLEKIEHFLSTFKGRDSDVADGIADITIDDDDDATSAPYKGLKYMQQLVRVSVR